MNSRHCMLNIQTNGNAGITHTFGLASGSRSADTNGESKAANSRRLIVDFSPATGTAADVGQRTGANANNRPQNARLLPYFLSELIGNTDFLIEPISVTVPGHGEFPVAELFVNFADVTPEHVGRFHGYWGNISYTDHSNDGNCLYYNSGDKDAVSVLLGKKYFDVTKKRFGTLNLNGAVETYMLVFGTLSVSERGKKLIKITDQNYFYLRVMYR